MPRAARVFRILGHTITCHASLNNAESEPLDAAQVSTLAVFGAPRGETSEPADPGAVVTPGAQDAAAIPGGTMPKLADLLTVDEVLALVGTVKDQRHPIQALEDALLDRRLEAGEA